LRTATAADNVFVGLVAAWLWFTVLFANFAEAVAEGRGKAQADTLRKTRSETVAFVRQADGSVRETPSSTLQLGDRCVVDARQQTPNAIALNILLAGLTIIFLLATVTLQPFAIYSHAGQSITVLVALLVCLIPTTIGALLSAIGIAGMDRLVQRNVLAMSGRAVEAAGDVNTLLLDKTGTITIGNRQASEFLAVRGVTAAGPADAAPPSSMADYTPEGRSIVVLAKNQYGLRERAEGELAGAEFVEFTAQTRMSGVNLADGREVRKGASSAVREWIRANGGTPPDDLGPMV